MLKITPLILTYKIIVLCLQCHLDAQYLAGISSAKITLPTASSVCLTGNKVMEPGVPREVSGLLLISHDCRLEATRPRMRRHQTSGVSLKWLVRSAGLVKGSAFPQIFLNFPQFSSTWWAFRPRKKYLAPPPLPTDIHPAPFPLPRLLLGKPPRSLHSLCCL